MTVYLSPEPPRWRPTSEPDVQAAIDEELLAETHYFDGKREVGSQPRDRKELARDLASFAIDGGALLIGVDELKEQRTWRLEPQPLHGLAERVKQIALQLVDPPLYVQSTEIPTGGDREQGYLLVEVPASAQAPHMVDNIYFGRGDKTRTRLSDAEVLRLHARRESVESVAHLPLDIELARDPQPVLKKRRGGRLYAVAQPLTARADLGLALTSGPSLELRQMALSAESVLNPGVRAGRLVGTRLGRSVKISRQNLQLFLIGCETRR